MRDTPHDVFISYSSKDKTTADAVCAVLERNGIRCWIAPRDVLPGDEWARSIIQAINGAKIFVLLFSESSNTSAQIKREVERAANREMPIIPFRVSDIAPNQSLEYFISTPHWMDAFSPPLESHIQQLSDNIARILAKPGLRETVPGEPVSEAEPRRAPPLDALPPRRSWLVPGLIAGGVVLLGIILFLVLGRHGSQAPSPPSEAPPPSAATTAATDQPAAAPASGEGADLSGTWSVAAIIEHNGQMAAEATPVCTFKQVGERIDGTCKGPNGLGPAAGIVSGDRVSWKWAASAYTAQGSSMTLSFRGALGPDGVIRGTATALSLRGLVGHFTQQRQ